MGFCMIDVSVVHHFLENDGRDAVSAVTTVQAGGTHRARVALGTRNALDTLDALFARRAREP